MIRGRVSLRSVELHFSALVVLIISMLVLFACSTDDAIATGDELGTVNFYLPGYHQEGDEPDKACYWVNGVRKTLEFPEGVYGTRAMAVTVFNGIVYAGGDYVTLNTSAGYDRIESAACYWKNGSIIKLQVHQDYESSQVYGIEVNSSGVYVAGSYTASTYTASSDACYWIDDGLTIKRVTLPIPIEATSRANIITVDNNGWVYAAGSYDDYPHVACYWIDKGDGVIERVSLDIGDAEWPNFEINSITVSGGKVYIAGSQGYKACYWVDGVLVPMEFQGKDSTAYGIAVSGTTVYTVGSVDIEDVFEPYAALWTDTVFKDISPGVIALPIAVTLYEGYPLIGGIFIQIENFVDGFYDTFYWYKDTLTATGLLVLDNFLFNGFIEVKQ